MGVWVHLADERPKGRVLRRYADILGEADRERALLSAEIFRGDSTGGAGGVEFLVLAATRHFEDGMSV